MACSFSFRAVFDSMEKAGIVFRVLEQEMNLKHEKRSSSRLSIEGKTVSLGIFSAEKKALKASINSYIKLLDLSARALEVI